MMQNFSDWMEKKMSEDLVKAEEKPEEEIDMKDWSDGDPRLKILARTKREPIWIDHNIDYDVDNMWLTNRKPSSE